MYCCIESLPQKLVSNIEYIDNRYCSLFIRWLFLFLIIKQMCVLCVHWTLSSMKTSSVVNSVACPCTAAWRGTPERGRAPRTSCGTWTWRHTCSCWLGDTWLTCVTQHASGETDEVWEVAWIMLAESPSASRRKKWRKNSFLFCRIFRSDYPINVWKLVTAADYRDNQGKWNWYLRAYSWTWGEHVMFYV